MSDDLGPDPAVISDEEAIDRVRRLDPEIKKHVASSLLGEANSEALAGGPPTQAELAPSDHETDAAFDAVARNGSRPGCALGSDNGSGLPALPALTSQVADWPKLAPVALYGLPGEVVQTLKPHTEADPVAVLVSFLTLYGGAVGRGPHACADRREHPARLGVVIVGKTAKARKGVSYAQGRQILAVADPGFVAKRILGGFGSGESLVDAVSDGDRRLLVYEPEFARILNVARREGSTVSSIFRQMWDGDRLEARSHGKTSVADEAHVPVLGHITRDELRAKLTETEVADGFANRFLFVLARRSKRLPSGGNLDDSTVHDLGKKTQVRLEKARTVGILRRSPEAEERWAVLYDEMGDDDPGGLLGSVIARDEPQVLRLSVAYALTDASRVIELHHLEAAWALWCYCRASAAHIFGDALGDEVADKLLTGIRQAGEAGLDGTGQSGLFSRHITKRQLEIARESLERRELIITTTEETDGRPRLVSIAKKAN